eukprot:CAMPEP_0181250636 /NCGR_PEP_ID=MMETSP1096-20121128/46428_1 /TAXON_ID=156174 ORGANISM="Chrysochromulina ericina, Strain CCMP281" /NCGR_SAMPLE_ID=MMETSP1096 /ASSEMBLY_ACC=CAM_ASM_000453 /LENGTH=129 /DNA_ID=CAMNT_0023348123 /DNA_START=472 /DNA_END=861 /DNA_ORIENTATION=+
MTPGTRVRPTCPRPSRLLRRWGGNRHAAGFVGNTGSLGRPYSAETAETALLKLRCCLGWSGCGLWSTGGTLKSRMTLHNTAHSLLCAETRERGGVGRGALWAPYGGPQATRHPPWAHMPTMIHITCAHM